jgi:hypothetical protein
LPLTVTMMPAGRTWDVSQQRCEDDKTKRVVGQGVDGKAVGAAGRGSKSDERAVRRLSTPGGLQIYLVGH